MLVETRNFREIWSGLTTDGRANLFRLASKRGLRESTIRCYASGKRRARGGNLYSLALSLKAMGVNVNRGENLFSDGEQRNTTGA